MSGGIAHIKKLRSKFLGVELAFKPTSGKPESLRLEKRLIKKLRPPMNGPKTGQRHHEDLIGLVSARPIGIGKEPYRIPDSPFKQRAATCDPKPFVNLQSSNLTMETRPATGNGSTSRRCFV
jgi:hypothetical protein